MVEEKEKEKREKRKRGKERKGKERERRGKERKTKQQHFLKRKRRQEMSASNETKAGYT